MFFPERIVSIKPTDKVLEIGPGATPYFRSDVFLEKRYESEADLVAQSGRVGLLQTDKPVVLYDGGGFPFSDKEFDYVICSHVLEHVENADLFLKEIQRVGIKGYLEYPTIYYDYIYNIPEHTLFLLYKNGVINWMTKEESGLNKYSQIQEFLFVSLGLGYQDLVNQLKEYFFQGFEWFDVIESKRVSNFSDLTYQNIENLLTSHVRPAVYVERNNNIDFSKVSFKKYLKYRLKKIVE